MSLSPVEISTCSPDAAAPRARACRSRRPPRRPGSRSSGRPSACTASSSGSICARRSSGIGGRCDLYSANSSSRKVLPGASNTTATRSGRCSRCIRSSMLSTPSTAPVGSPRELVSGGSAWNARYRYDEPSMRTSVCASTTARRPGIAARQGRGRRSVVLRPGRRGAGVVAGDVAGVVVGSVVVCPGPRITTSSDLDGRVSGPLRPQPVVAAASSASSHSRRRRLMRPTRRERAAALEPRPRPSSGAKCS